jgi:uncharacterized protein (DUF2252 family)
MAQSAHAYVRGSAQKSYEWLSSASACDIPVGPPIWICGDCHVSNLGPIASSDGRIEIALRDFDQTVIGNPAHDLIRLGLSLATAARGSDLPGVVTVRVLEALTDGYVRGIHRPEIRSPKAGKSIEPVEVALRQSLKRKWRHLANAEINGADPTIPKGKCFWPLSKKERQEIEHLVQREETRKLVTCLRKRDDDDEISIADAAYWIKGCSSLGRLRYAVLVHVGKRKKGSQGFCLIDMKEAAPAAAPHADRPSMPRNHAMRIVSGARQLSPLLGERMLPAQLCNRPVFVRELMPQDLKLEVDELSCDEAVALADFLAQIVGQAHGRQLDAGSRRQWIGALQQLRSKTIEAPGWLWQSVVELIAIHEKAYLDHCRRYASGGPATARHKKNARSAK